MFGECLYYYFYDFTSTLFYRWQQSRSFTSIKAEGHKIPDLLFLKVKILEQLVLALCIIAITTPYLQLNHILMIVVVDDKVGASFVACLRFYIVMSNTIDNWTYIKLELLASMLLNELGIHCSIFCTENFVEVFGELLQE